MDSNNELKQIDIKNCRCYYFHDTFKIIDFVLDNVLIDGKYDKNILVYNNSHKTLIDATPFHIKFNKVNGFIRVYDGNKFYMNYFKNINAILL